MVGSWKCVQTLPWCASLGTLLLGRGPKVLEGIVPPTEDFARTAVSWTLRSKTRTNYRETF